MFNKREIEDLVVEVKNALRNFDFSDAHLGGAPPAGGSPSDRRMNVYLKISLIERKELDRKLPLKISPEPDSFHRIHLFHEFRTLTN